jgi:hypothetical protein
MSGADRSGNNFDQIENIAGLEHIRRAEFAIELLLQGQQKGNAADAVDEQVIEDAGGYACGNPGGSSAFLDNPDDIGCQSDAGLTERNADGFHGYTT